MENNSKAIKKIAAFDCFLV